MEDLLAGERPIDFAVENDFQYILDSGVFQNVPLADHLDGLHSNHIVDLWEDPLLSDQFPYDEYDEYDESLSPKPHIKTDHCYSIANEPDYPFFKTIKVEPEDYESDNINVLPLSPELSQPLSLVKKEIDNFSDDSCDMDTSRMQQFVLNEPLKPHLKPKQTQPPMVVDHMTKHDMTHLQLELLPLSDDCGDDNVDLPPTPPSSTPSDSEGGCSPQRHSPLSEPGSPAPYHSPIKKPESRTTAITAHMFTNLQRLPQSGPMVLTDEEKRTLVAEGYPIPATLPLTKAEEKALKKVRRKIKNKISAQESRRKKKEYVEALEKRMESYTHENGELRKKVDNLETTNESLAQQLERLQAIVSKISRPIKASATQTGTCLMVLVLCFAVFLGSWSPHSLFNNSNSSTLFSKSVSPSSSFPEPFPYGPTNNKYNNDLGERNGPIFGPEEDPYATPSRYSSRLLMSVDEDDDCANDVVLNPYMTYTVDDVPPGVYHPVKLPDGPNPNDYTTSADNILSSGATGSAIQLQASLHPDIQVEVPVDTLASINRSSNK